MIPFALTLFFCKLVAYTFLFWLPYYLSSARIGARRLSPQVSLLRACCCMYTIQSHIFSSQRDSHSNQISDTTRMSQVLALTSLRPS